MGNTASQLCEAGFPACFRYRRPESLPHQPKRAGATGFFRTLAVLALAVTFLVPDKVRAAENPISGETTESLVNSGEAACSDGRFHEAVRLYTVAAKQDPEDAKIHLGLGSAYEMLGQEKNAEEAYKRAIKLDGSDYRSMENLARIYERRGDNNDAVLTLYREALKLDPRPEWRESLAAWIAMLETRLEPATDSAVGCWHLGNRKKLAGALDEADAWFSRAIELNPEFFQGYYSRGLVRLEAGKAREALAEFERTVKLVPRFAPASLHVGLALEQLGEEPRALEHVRRAVQLDSRDAEALYHLARLLESNGDASQARAVLGKALELKLKPELRDRIHRSLARLPVSSAKSRENSAPKSRIPSLW
jgi:tetratricopeptide (TPR) repeat protein